MSKSAGFARMKAQGLSLIWLWWLPIVLVGCWWVLSSGSTNFYFPSLEKIFSVMMRDFANGLLWKHMLASLGNMAMGLIIATVLGVGFGLVIGELRSVREATGPFLNFVRAIPPAAIVPIVIVAMGVGAEPKVFIIAFACVWPILLNTIDGVKGMNPQLMETARAFQVPFVLRNRKVLFMAALPQIMAGLRISLAVSLVLMVISEFVGASEGLGFYIREKKESFAMAEAWSGTILTGVLGFLLSSVFLWFERWTLAWYFQSDPTHQNPNS